MTKLDQLLNEIKGGDVLDVADSSGYFLNYINKFKDFDKVTIVDIKISDAARQNYNKKVEYSELDAVQLPYKDECFDTVCISNSLHHLPALNKTLGEMSRVLKPRGTFIINEMFRDGQNKRQKSHVIMHHWKEKILGVLDDIESKESFKRKEIIDIANLLPIREWNTLIYNFEVVPDAEPIYEYTGKDRYELLDDIDIYIDRIKDRFEFEYLVEQGEQLKERILTIGFAPCSSMIMIGKKED